MKVIEQLVEHLFSKGSLGDSEVAWLRDQGFLPSLTELSDAEDLLELQKNNELPEQNEYEGSGLVALDDLEQQQKQEDLQRELNAPIHSRARARIQRVGGGGGNRSKHPSPSVRARQEQRIVSENVRSSEELPRRAAILALLNLLTSQPQTVQGPVMNTRAAIMKAGPFK